MKIVPAKVDVLGGVAVLVGLYFLYGRHGNAQDVLSQGSSAIRWMVGRWNWEAADMSHGWLIPPISLFVVWCRRKALLAAPRRTTWLGLALVVMALAVHVVGYRAQLTRLSLLSLIGLLLAGCGLLGLIGLVRHYRRAGRAVAHHFRTTTG